MSAITPYDWATIAFVIGVTFLCVFMLTVPLLFGGKTWGRAKHEQFESGVVSASATRIRMPAQFYLVAIFFVVFDIEVLYLYAWSSALREAGWFGFVTAAIFVVDLLIGLIYAIAVGALDWSPREIRKAQAVKGYKPKLGSANMDIAQITRFNSIDELVVDPTGKVPAQSAQKIAHNTTSSLHLNKE